jgi:hypothetical protein
MTGFEDDRSPLRRTDGRHPMVSAPFRALFLPRNRMESVQVVPLGGTHPDGRTIPGGILEGRAELLAFVTAIGFDSVVESFQVSDLPRPSFLRSYHLAPTPGTIIRLLDERLAAEPLYTHRVLDMTIEKTPEQLTLSPQEAFQLGATTVDASEGNLRTARWFEERRREA